MDKIFKSKSTVNGWNPKVKIFGAFQSCPIPKLLISNSVWNPNHFVGIFRRSVDQLDQPNVRILDIYGMYNWTIEQTEQPKCLQSERLKSELNFVQFSKPNLWNSDIYCIHKKIQEHYLLLIFFLKFWLNIRLGNCVHHRHHHDHSRQPQRP